MFAITQESSPPMHSTPSPRNAALEIVNGDEPAARVI
jgi:hypothetical protein